MPDDLPVPVFVGAVVLQVLLFIALVLLCIKITRAIHAQGATVFPKELTAKMKKLFGRDKP